MMTDLLMPFLALAILSAYPVGVEPLVYNPWISLGGVAGLIGLQYLVGWRASSQFLAGHRREDPTVTHRYHRALLIAQIHLLVTYSALVFLAHWPLLVTEAFESPMSRLLPSRPLDFAALMALLVLMDLLKWMPFLLALVAFWLGQFPAERTLRVGNLTLGAFLRFRLQTLTAFGLIPLLLLMALYRGLWFVPLWNRELEVFPFLAWLAMGVLSLALFAAAPLLLRFGFRARPIPCGPLRTRLEACCLRAGFRCNNLLIWNTCGTRTLNAFVTGLIPRLRYVFFTDALIERLQPDEVEGVLAHEMGHIARRHFWWLLALLIGYAALAVTILSLEERLFGDAFLPEVATWIVFLVVFWGGVVGFLSRRFETEADLYAARLMGDPLRYAGALQKVVLVNRDAASRGSWRHPSPLRRLAFLAGVSQFPLLEVQFNLGLRRLLLVILFFIGASLVGAWHAVALQLETAPDRWSQVERQEEAYRWWERADASRRAGHDEEAVRRLQKARDLAPDNPRLLSALGDALSFAGRRAEAHDAFEAARAKTPRDLRIRQYLAERLGR
jgi:Zn-dependent protease with chaperone function